GVQTCALPICEGEVVLAVPDPELRERLAGQLQLLDQLRRPRLLEVAPQQPQQLDAQLESTHRFEWFAARQPFRGLEATCREAWLEQLTQRAAPGAQARLLFSHPTLGPAGSLATWLKRQSRGGQRSAPPPALLVEAQAAEAALLAAETQAMLAVQEGLEQRGWQVLGESWQEELELPLGEGLLQRWFAPGADYRARLEDALAATPDAATAPDALASLFHHHLGALLPQPLQHTLLKASRTPPEERRQGRVRERTKKPRPKPGPGG
ncbi:MAG: hypothetical protein ACKOZW_05620, partial [Cyanobium sp.]